MIVGTPTIDVLSAWLFPLIICFLKKNRERERVSTLSTELSDVLAARSELEGEVGERQQKEGEMLSFHQRMAAMNAELQSQHTKLSDDVSVG